MAAKKINYGKKSLTSSLTDAFPKPLVLLPENIYTNNMRTNSDVIVKKCFCTECKTISDVDLSFVRPKDAYLQDVYIIKHSDINNAEKLNNLECPNCHNKEFKQFAPRTPQRSPKENNINMSDSWHIPRFYEGRYLFTFTDENNKVTRLEDNTIMSDITVFPSGKKFQYAIETSEITDLIKNDVKVTVTKVIGDKREILDTKTSLDGFLYKPEESFEMHQVHNMTQIKDVPEEHSYVLNNTIRPHSTNNDVLTTSPLMYQEDKYKIESQKSFKETTNVPRDSAESPEYAIHNFAKTINEYKRKTIEKRFENLESIYTDSYANRLYLNRHQLGDTEDNTDLNPHSVAAYYNMMIRYPVAYEYACERVNDRVVDHGFAEQRKAKNDPSYSPREVPDSAKARMLREEVKYVAEQLYACDNKILKTIHDSKDVNDMKEKLQFFVFGTNEKIQNTQVPRHIALKDGQTLGDNIDATKALKASFKKNPIATASNVYTCHKMGINDINHVNALIAIASDSPDVNPKPKRVPGYTFANNVSYQKNANAGVIVPITNKNAMQFMRNFANTHSHSEVIESFKPENYEQLAECMRIYGTITPYAKIAETEEEIKKNKDNILKNQIRNYLSQKTVKEAYVDFIEKFDKATPEVINQYVREIEQDKKNIQMKHFYDKNGFEKTMDVYKDELSKHENPEEFLKNIEDTTHKCVLVTRNSKPLFKNRNLSELHDELSHLAKNVTKENVKIPYTEKELSLEADYEAPDGSGTWSFELHKDTYEMVRTATEMSNCLASHATSAPSKRMLYLYMKNEIGEKVACISINNLHKWSVGEFQAPHDNAVDGRYKDICLQWLNEHDINYRGNYNVEAIGTDASFFGGRNADLHRTEVDEVENATVSVSTMNSRKQKRQELAAQIYGVDENGNILLPEVPEF